MRALVTLGLLCALATPLRAEGVCHVKRLDPPPRAMRIPVNAHLWVQEQPLRLVGPSGDVPFTTNRIDGGQIEIVPSVLEPGARYRLFIESRTIELTVSSERDTTPPLRPALAEDRYALPIWPDTAVYEVGAIVDFNPLTTLSFAIAVDDTRIDPVALSCAGLRFEVGDTICFGVRAVDAAGNRSPVRLSCMVVDGDFFADSIPYCPSADYSRWHRGEDTLGSLAALSVFVFIGVVWFVIACGRRALALAAGGEPTSIGAVEKLARRTRTVVLAVTAGWIAALIVSLSSLLVVWWIPVLALPAGWRAHKALSGDAATLREDYVHIWRDGKLRAWLRVRPKRLAELAVPTARARKRGMLD